MARAARGIAAVAALGAFLFLGTSFIAPNGCRRAVDTEIHRATGAGGPQDQSFMGSASTVALPLLGLAALCSTRSRRPAASTTVMPMPLAGAALPVEADEPAVVMHTAGGRRKRLGVGGKICMLTGLKKFKGIYRSYSGKKNVRFWRPNCRWHNVWWAKEKKWVRLFISMAALRKMDEHGLDYMARRAGLDLYAWTKEHWEPGSRQPLRLKVSTTGEAIKDKRLWPDYDKYLNQGKPWAEIFAGPKYSKKPLPWNQRKALKNPATPPKGLKVSASSSVSSDA